MNRMRLLILAAALLAALLAGYLAIGILQRPAPEVVQVPAPKNETVDVLVAAKDLSAGERLGANGVQWRAWPREGISPDMFARDAMPDAAEKMTNARARVTMVAGEPILPGKIVQLGESGFMSSVLPPGMLAVSVPISELSAVSGFVLPNDRVDVILRRVASVDDLGNKVSTGEAVITNVKVLAINQTLPSDSSDAAIPDGRTAVLEVDSKQAEVLAKIQGNGEILLALRSIEDAGDGKPVLAESYRNPARARPGPLVIRYGSENRVPGLPGM